eukprot:NODE_680_length_4796_cov_0.472855.p1 type:complete len:338 gc:universal NODE_680_length_4796_cov_0.472855:1600-587(-)
MDTRVSAEYELSYLLAFKYLNTIILHPFHLSKLLMQLNYRPLPISPKLPRHIDLDTYLHEKQIKPQVKTVKRDADGYAYTPYHESIIKTVHQQMKDHSPTSLYSGHTSFYYISVIDALLRPLLESLIAEYLGIDEFDVSIPMTFIKLTSYLATSLVTLPLEALNARQIAQHPNSPTYKTTTQSLQLLNYRNLPFKSHLLYHTTSFTMHKLSYNIGMLFYNPLSAPIRFSLIEYALNCFGMLIELPLETVYRRQLAKSEHPYPTRIPLSQPLGIRNGLQTLYDETCFGTAPISIWQKFKIWVKMCRGYGMNLMVNSLICISHIVMHLDEKSEHIGSFE